jgi:HK97 family phage portal protein
MLHMIGRLAASLPGLDGWRRPDPNTERLWSSGTAYTSRAGVPVSTASVMQLDVVQSVLENLGGAVSTLPVVIYRRDPDGERVQDRTNPLHALLNDRPNRRQSAQEFRDAQTRHLAFYRNAYTRVRGEGAIPVTELEPIHPERIVAIEQDEQGRVYYRVRSLGLAPDEILRDDAMWHIRKAPLTQDGLRGLSVVETGRETFGRAIGVREYGDDYFANGGASGGTLQHPGKFASKVDQTHFLDTWREGGTGRNRHKDRLLLNGVTYTPISVKNNEAQFLETIANTDIQVCRLWNMPPHRVGILDRATLANIEQQSIDYVVYTLAPWICAWEQAAERDLAFDLDGSGTVHVEINVAGLLRGDLTARYKAYAAGRQWGWLSVNDIRHLENFNTIGTDGDIYLQPKNMGDAGDELDDGTEPAGDAGGRGRPAGD